MRMTRSLNAPVSPLDASQHGTPVRFAAIVAWAALAALAGPAAAAPTPLADDPIFSNRSVAGNVAMALSVEYPTAISVANTGAYSSAKEFLGYFDPNKCYDYKAATAPALSYFVPVAKATAHVCRGQWSGNFLNWATMPTIDPFRWALTGGYRVIDQVGLTVLEKAYASDQGETANFPDRNLLDAASVAGATPFTRGALQTRVRRLGKKLRFTNGGELNDAGAPFVSTATPFNGKTVLELDVRVKVCDSEALAAGIPLEDNCVAYGKHYKPEGLIQKYAKRIRFSAFGYLNESGNSRNGGVLRASQKFVGPTQPRPGNTDIASARPEWDAATGVFIGNPDSADAAATATAFGVNVANSGVINYLNKFGQNGTKYKSNDPVSELYYAVTRYFRNLGNVDAWTAPSSTDTQVLAGHVDGFPVITTWDDPIQYSCQKNYILGIGDVNTHSDKNIDADRDAAFDAVKSTQVVGTLEGITGLETKTNYPNCCGDNSALIAGLAYSAHTSDIRPDVPGLKHTTGMQNISTYWIDVLEYERFYPKNQYWLATKYGGFELPLDTDGKSTYQPGAKLPSTESWYSTKDTIEGTTEPRPDNYFAAKNARQMIDGLQKTFDSISSKMRANSTGLALAEPQLAAEGMVSYSASFNADGWTGEVTAHALSFDGKGELKRALQWTASETLGRQLGSGGWNTDRRVATWNGTRGVPFVAGQGSQMTAAQLAALDTPYVEGDDRASFINYLRGERANEQGASDTAKGYRVRKSLLGDISGAKVTTVAAPAMPYADSVNPGYSAFKALHADREAMVFVGSNDGMLHVFGGGRPANGATAARTAGREIFAYVPSALIQGATAPGTDGLAALGNPQFVHRPYVNATPVPFDIDFARTYQETPDPAAGTAKAADWRTVLIGGLGKGGKSFYAIDVTNPEAFTTEAQAAQRVLWEFPNKDTPADEVAKMGFSFGAPVVVKTEKYGWVVIFTSGYNNMNPEGGGHFFFVHPVTGKWLRTVSVPSPTKLAGASEVPPVGLAHAQSVTLDYTNNLAESLYAGDLLGRLWRVDLRGTGEYIAEQVALLGTPEAPQPVTTRPVILVHPKTNERHVMVGTGRLLADADIRSEEKQSFYSIKDGDGSKFSDAVTAKFPITRGQLIPNTDTTKGIVEDPAKPTLGWYVDFPVSREKLEEVAPDGSGKGQTVKDISVASRMVVDPDAFHGLVAFAATMPSADPCMPSGTSLLYGVDFASGKSQLVVDQAGKEVIVPSLERDSMVTEVKIVNDPQTAESAGPRKSITAGYADGKVEKIRVSTGDEAAAARIGTRQLKSPTD